MKNMKYDSRYADSYGNYLRIKSTSYIIMLSCALYLTFLIFNRPEGFIVKAVLSTLAFFFGFFMNPKKPTIESPKKDRNI